MAKKKIEKEIEPQLFYIKDIDGFVKNNTPIEVVDYRFREQNSVKVVFKNGTIILTGQTTDTFKRQYCSCTNFLEAHYSVVANIMRKQLINSDAAYIYGYDNNANLQD